MTSPLEKLPNTYRAFFSGFSALTAAQNELISPILRGEDVVLQASTGTGKTEAVLAPATEKLMTHPDHFTIVYIVPTRALALDMNRRIRPIYKRLNLKSGMRTGDGKNFRDGKPHLLIMTPESLDVMLGSQNPDNKYFLKNVRIMIIDEVHVFLHDDRGRQLSYLHRRLALQSVGALQTIALSATIHSAEDVMSFFSLKTSPFYYKQSNTRKLQPSWVHIEDEEDELTPFFDDLYRRSGCKKLLVFANSRKKCEQVYDILNRGGVFSQHVFIHYSNLSTQERKSIEASFRDGKMGVCVATSTLELGIDIGDIDGVVLIGPPPSSMAFLQRIGRGNRRQQHINFWGISYGPNAGMHLVRFLAFFELAKEHQVEKCFSSEKYSVLFQQILSTLYAKKTVSKEALSLCFKEHLEDLPSIFHQMLANHWLKPTKQPEIYHGGWRYFSSLTKRQIWSNFPPTDEEYDVILEYEKIAVLPLSIVRQVKVGDLIRLTGKVLKVLQIEENKAALEVWVEESRESTSKELVWIGFGPPTTFEVAQKMRAILLDTCVPQGLLSRTRRILEKERENIAGSFEQPNGIRVYRRENGIYRYETFLGSIANYILYKVIEEELSSKIEGLSVNFDEMGLESNEWIPFPSVKIPHTVEQFRAWIGTHLPQLKSAFSWNSWMRWLSEEHQEKEIAARLYDPRVLQHFQRYHSQRQWMPLPGQQVNDDKEMAANHIDLKGGPWSLENEKCSWGILSFPHLPVNEQDVSVKTTSKLTAGQVQGYVTQKLCPRWARFQELDYQTEAHPRFSAINEAMQSRRQQGSTFKKEVIEALQNQACVCFETPQLTWQQAIRAVISNKAPLFQVQAKLQGRPEDDDSIELSGSPDLIYIKHQGSHISLEIWDIKFSQVMNYAQKWKIAFCAYLLDNLLKGEIFSLPVEISSLGGFVYPSTDPEKLFEKTPFVLAPYRTWIPRLLAQWKVDSRRSSASQHHQMEFSCTSCRYFSYCYQETLLTNAGVSKNQTIVSRNIESNDFPKNSKHWYFIHYENGTLWWQGWENGVAINAVCMRLYDFPNEEAFQSAAASQLQKAWIQSVDHRKNPHVLVYESADWQKVQKKFRSTPLNSLWNSHVAWTSIQSVLQTHFIWPIDGRITPKKVGACLGFLNCLPQPLSLYHREPFADASLDLCREIWNWCLSNVKSQRVVSFENNKERTIPLIHAYLAIHHRESEYRKSEILSFQKNPLEDRIKQCRAIGPIRFLGTLPNKEGYQFSMAAGTMVAKFRAGDFLKLSPVGTGQIQDGFSVVLDSYSPEQGLLSIRPLSQKMPLSRHHLYALDEDATDWNAVKITKVLGVVAKLVVNASRSGDGSAVAISSSPSGYQRLTRLKTQSMGHRRECDAATSFSTISLTRLKDPKCYPTLIQMLLGHAKSFASPATHWIENWYQSRASAARLNHLQQRALILPFREKIGLIEGPPGTGKTHLLVWTLIALVAHATSLNRSIKILVTAQTHHAIDQILKKVAKTLPEANVTDVSLWKYGRFDEGYFSKLDISHMQGSEMLHKHSSMILGATGYGVYQLLENKNYPQLFDWVVFDEASQILAPYALLSLIFGKGQALFYGDTQQLPPVLKGNYENTSLLPRSILQELISRYSPQNHLRLNETYRMNSEICSFASPEWYVGELHSVVSKKDQMLVLSNYPLFKDRLDDDLDPSKSMVVVQLDHLGSHQSSPEESTWIAKAVKRLIDDYGLTPEQIGIISPHRLQNNMITSALKQALPFSVNLPRVDTVERMQGSEFDIVIFSATVSDEKSVHSPFLKDYRRFNVALTRAKKKFIFVASSFFFQSFPKTEEELVAQQPFEKFFNQAVAKRVADHTMHR